MTEMFYSRREKFTLQTGGGMVHLYHVFCFCVMLEIFTFSKNGRLVFVVQIYFPNLQKRG